MRLLIFAGTKNGRELITDLIEDHIIIASSMSDYGNSLLPNGDNIIKIVGKKSSKDIEDIISSERIDLVIDCTHPYAKEISLNILEASKITGVKTIRFERQSTVSKNLGIHFCSMEDSCRYLNSKAGNILFTTGVNEVLNMVKMVDKRRIYVRVLSVQSSLNKIEESGIDSTHVVLKNPPFTLEENLKHIKEFNIKYLVTKDSGSEGNIHEKIEAVITSGIELLIIDRPVIEYSDIYYTIDEILLYIESIRLD